MISDAWFAEAAADIQKYLIYLFLLMSYMPKNYKNRVEKYLSGQNLR